MAFKIVHERESCIGCGACAAVCPGHWEMEDDGKSKLKGSKAKGENFELDVASLGCNEDAANACPVNIIHIFDKSGKKIK